MNHAIDLIVFAILVLAGLVMHVIGLVDGFLAGLMTWAGVPANAQIILLVVAAVWLAVVVIRALGGVFRALIIVLLILLLVRHAFPEMGLPPLHAPPGLNMPPALSDGLRSL